MTQYDKVFEFLKNKYRENDPIFLTDISIPDIKAVSVRQQLKKLIDDGRIKRFDTGIYYIPRKSLFKSGSSLSIDEVIRRKYLVDGNTKCGYISGLSFANKLGLTTQVPMVYEICSNKATTDYRDITIGKFRVVIRRPHIAVNDDNVLVLQFLDLLKDVTDISEVEGYELNERLLNYLKKKEIKFDVLKPYLAYYPDKIYKNMYEVGLLNGVAT